MLTPEDWTFRQFWNTLKEFGLNKNNKMQMDSYNFYLSEKWYGSSITITNEKISLSSYKDKHPYRFIDSNEKSDSEIEVFCFSLQSDCIYQRNRLTVYCRQFNDLAYVATLDSKIIDIFNMMRLSKDQKKVVVQKINEILIGVIANYKDTGLMFI